jgi:hypothetical protein
MTRAFVEDTSPLRIVSQIAADGNIPEPDCCGEAVETENEVRIV